MEFLEQNFPLANELSISDSVPNIVSDRRTRRAIVQTENMPDVGIESDEDKAGMRIV